MSSRCSAKTPSAPSASPVAHNRAAAASYGTLRALRDEQAINEAMGEKPKPGEHSKGTLSRIKSSCEPLVEYLLFAGEAPLAHEVSGSCDFATNFTKRGPRDSNGRSLREFDLKTRLFRYPCSYLVYSSAITELPAEAGDGPEQIAGSLAEFVDCLRTGASPDTEAHRNIISLAMVEAAVRSSAEGRRVDLAEVLRPELVA